MNKENQKIEYKSSWRDEYLKWIRGFANSDGGKLYIGIDDNGKVVGVDNAKKLLEEIPNKISDTLGIVCKVRGVKKDKKDVIEIVVDKYVNPISYKGKFYMRSGATNRELNNEDLMQLIEKSTGIKFESIVEPTFTMKEIDLTAVEAFKKMSIDCKRLPKEIIKMKPKELLEKLNLLDKNGKIKRAGILLFAKEPNKYIFNSHIKIGKFELNDADLKFQDEIDGPLITIVDKVVEKLYRDYFKGLIRYKGLYRIEEYIVNEDALREILLNAIIHKNYDSFNPIQISVYEDKIYIFNTAKFPENLMSEELLYKKHSSYPHNPLIANTFFRAGLIENWGRGFEKILEGVKINKGPRPSYDINSNGVMVLYNAQDEYIKLLKKNKNVTQDVPQDVTNVTNVTNVINSKKERIIDNIDDLDSTILNLMLKNSNISTLEIATICKTTKRTIIRHIDKLKKLNKLKYVGKTNNGHWEILK